MDTIAQGMEYELEQQLYSYRQAHKALLWAKVQANDTAEQQRLDQLLMENGFSNFTRCQIVRAGEIYLLVHAGDIAA